LGSYFFLFLGRDCQLLKKKVVIFIFTQPTSLFKKIIPTPFVKWQTSSLFCTQTHNYVHFICTRRQSQK